MNHVTSTLKLAYGDGYYDGFIVDEDSDNKLNSKLQTYEKNIAKSVIMKAVDSNDISSDPLETHQHKPFIGNMALTLMPTKNISAHSVSNESVAVKSDQPSPVTYKSNLGRGSMALSSYTPKQHEESSKRETSQRDEKGAVETLLNLKPKLNLEKTLVKLANLSFRNTGSNVKEVGRDKKEGNGLESVFSKIQPDFVYTNTSGRRNMLTNSTIKGFLSKNVNYTFKDVNKPKVQQPAGNTPQVAKVASTLSKNIEKVPKGKLTTNATQSHFFQKLYSKLYAKHHPGQDAAPGSAALVPVSRKLTNKNLTKSFNVTTIKLHHGKFNKSRDLNASVSQHPHLLKNVSSNTSVIAPVVPKTNASFSVNVNKTMIINASNHVKASNESHQNTVEKPISFNSSDNKVEFFSNHQTEDGDDTVKFINAVKQHRIHLIDPDELEILRHNNTGLKRKDVIDDQTDIECGENSTCPDGKYCHDLLCYACHRKHHECMADAQCCGGIPCVYGRCDDKAKGSPGTICNSDNDCGGDGCCVIEPTIDKKHGICKRMLEEFHQCSPVLFRKVWMGDQKPSCGPCKVGLECVEKGVSASHLICMKEKKE